MEPRDPGIEASPLAQLQQEISRSALDYFFGGETQDGIQRTTFARVATVVESIIDRLQTEGIKFPMWEVHKATLEYAQNTIFILAGVHTQERSEHLARRVFDIVPADIEKLVQKLFAEVYSRRRLGMQEGPPDEYDDRIAALPSERQFVLHGLIGLGSMERELQIKLSKKQGDQDELLDQFKLVSESYTQELDRALPTSEERELVEVIISKRVREFEDDQDLLGRLAISADAVPDYESGRQLGKESKDKEE